MLEMAGRLGSRIDLELVERWEKMRLVTHCSKSLYENMSLSMRLIVTYRWCW